jgi:G3E family GTPase
VRERVLGLATAKLSEHVGYIYRKQLEEAEIIVINKCDLVDAPRLDPLRAALAAVNPQATILECSARDGIGLGVWFERLLAENSQAAAIAEIDYDRYALGESLLGWLNAEVRIGAAGTTSAAEFDGNELLVAILSQIRTALEASGHEIAHLKGTLAIEGDPYELAAANLVRTADSAHLSHRLAEPVDIGRLLLNLRAEADPADLEQAVRVAVSACAVHLPHEILHLEHFRPGRPVPTHRIPARV